MTRSLVLGSSSGELVAVANGIAEWLWHQIPERGHCLSVYDRGFRQTRVIIEGDVYEPTHRWYSIDFTSTIQIYTESLNPHSHVLNYENPHLLPRIEQIIREAIK